jgi:hypothetical protein
VRVERFLGFAAWAAVAAGAALFLLNTADLIRKDLPGDYVEGVVLAAHETVAAGGSAFDRAAWTTEPYRINLYGPVHYQLGAWALKFSGKAGSLVPGRLLSVLALALAMVALWRLIRRGLGLSAPDALFGLLLPLGYLPVLIFAPQNRVDTFAIAASLWGLSILAEGRRWSPFVAGAFFVLAVFTKPTAIAAPVAAFLWLLARREFRGAIGLAATCSLVGGMWLVALNAATNGAFLAATAFNGVYPFALGGFTKAVQLALAAAPVPLLVGLALASVVSRGGVERLAAGYFLLAFFLSLATVGKVGANLNYFIEPGLAMAPLAALAWNRYATTLPGASVAVAAMASLLLVSAPRVASEWRGRTERVGVEKTLSPILAGKKVLTMEIVSVLRAKGTNVVNDPCIFAFLPRSGKWDETALLGDLRNGRVDLVLSDADLSIPNPVFSNWSPAVRREVSASWRLSRVVGSNLFLYEPQAVPR